MTGVQTCALPISRFCPEIYFEKRVFKHLRAAKKRGVNIEIIVSDPGADPGMTEPDAKEKLMNFREFRSWADRGEVTVIQSAEKKYPHFIIVDDIHVRIEKTHQTKTRSPEKIRAITKYIDVDTAEKHLESFKYLKSLT
mgnify:CR=1 FL=1